MLPKNNTEKGIFTHSQLTQAHAINRMISTSIYDESELQIRL